MDEEIYLEREIIALAIDTAAGASRIEKLKALKARLQTGDDPLLAPPPASGHKEVDRNTTMHALLAKQR